MPALDVAVRYSDGRKEVVKVGRPADLIAFADQFGHIAPEPPYAIRELAWLVHRALKVTSPLEAWVETLDDVSSADDAIAAVRAELEHGGTAPDPTPPVERLVPRGMPATPTPAPSSAGESLA